ncbi:MAG: FKBP-type peptidyl-prolyl cis-trans isomerase [Pseudomonadota bacterium]|nr:FKBP-type peptidyl-prolyl cis-trans isomerase [Pseudomonadota bacterium]
MQQLMRGFAALSILAALCLAPVSVAQDRPTLASEREQVSYMVGMDVGGSIKPAGPDINLEAFERALRHALDGGKPLLTEAEAQAVAPALMQRIAQRDGRPVPGVAPGAATPPVARDKVGLLVGADVGRSLAPIRDELELPLLLQGLRDVLQARRPLLAEAEANALRMAFSTRMQVKLQARAAESGRSNAAEGAAFLAGNKAAKGVFSTPSGLQYRVLRQGAGPRPRPNSRVRVHYQGTLLDGTVFDSSYDRGQPAEFGLGEVIPGWTEGVAMMPVGAKYRFWIPGELGYGESGSPGGIGPNATLVFDVELLQVL